MPYINVQTTVKLSEEKAERVKTLLGKAITVIPGKSESWLMVELEGEKSIWFRGNADGDSAFISVSVYGSLTDSAADKMTREVCDIIEKELGVPTDRIYVRYSEHDKWGFNGSNF